VILGRSGTTWGSSYDAHNHYTSFGSTYDSNGNVTFDGNNTYQWNGYGKLTSTATSGTPTCGTSGKCITYDAFGRMVETSNGSTWSEHWITQLGDTVNFSSTQYNFSQWPAPAGGTMLHQAGGTGFYLHKDWLGNARDVSYDVGNSNYAYRYFAPYGEVYGANGVTGSQVDIFAGLTDNFDQGVMWDSPNREYSVVGRWLSPDPAGASWNAYAYTTNPNSFTDPSGLCPQHPDCPTKPGDPGWDVGPNNMPDKPSGGNPLVYSHPPPPLPGMSADSMDGFFGFMQGNFGPSISGRTNSHAPGWVLFREDRIKSSSSGIVPDDPIVAAMAASDRDIRMDIEANVRALAPAMQQGNATVQTFMAGQAVLATSAAAVYAGPTIATTVANRLLFGPVVNRVFWSGAGYFAAHSYALMNEGTTLEDSPLGKTLDLFTQSEAGGFGISYQTMRPFWDTASGAFARGATGNVLMFPGLNGYIGPTFGNIEQPILSGSGIGITYIP
jgi:RHS repeat-associated protein